MTIAADPGSDRNEAGGELHPTGRPGRPSPLEFVG